MEADEDGVTAKNTYGGPLLLRTVFHEDGSEDTYEYMYNAHGDVVTLLTDGEVVATYYYDSFGNVLDQTGNVSNSILYAGYQYDVETGLYYINARMYDPVTARFLQADTYLGSLNDPLSLNLYTYCLNNPHKYVDPSGHSVLLAFLLVVAVSFAVGAGMEYINQRFIEQRDVINYDLILYEGIFNAVIAAVSFGTANLGATAARQGLRLTARTTTRAVGRSMAFGAMEGATEELGRQLVEGKSFGEIDYGQVAFSATINGITGGIGGYSGAKKEAFDYARQATKGNIRKYAQWNVGADDVVEAGTSGSQMKNLQSLAGEGAYQSGRKFTGATFEGTIYRSVNSKYDPLEMSLHTIKANHRYTEAGVPGLYFSSGEKIVKAELGNYDVFDFSNRTMYSYNVKLENMLDVSNPSVRSKMGISLESIVGESYDVTHAIGRYAYSNDYNGIIAPSARADGGINIILFNAKGVR